MNNIFGYLASGFANLFNLTSLLLVLLGVCVGILGGAIPGISPSMAVALLLPMTYKMEPTLAIIMLMGIYIGALLLLFIVIQRAVVSYSGRRKKS